MLLPRMFTENIDRDRNLMRTDVKETDTAYEVDVDLPGYKKEDLSLELESGYLTINATRKTENDRKDKEGNYVRRERFYGNCRRSFYVGEDVEQSDVAAKFEDGVLKLTINKKEPTKVEAKNNRIAIEG